MKILLLLFGFFSTYSQSDTLKTALPDSVKTLESSKAVAVDSVIIPVIRNHAPVILRKEPELLWFNNFRQVVTFQFPTKGFYRDEENHELAFRLVSKDFAGIRLSSEGLLSAQLSLVEYQKLPFLIDYEIFETNTPENLSAKGQLLLRKAKNDVPPSINIYPKTLKYSIEEGDSVAIRIVVSDLNEDLKEFEAYSSVQFGRFNPQKLIQKTGNPNEYWLKWLVPYDFVLIRTESDDKKRTFQLIFEAKDETDSTNKVAIDVEVFDKLDWGLEDKIRLQDYEKVVFGATETLERMENKFSSMKKEISKLLKNKKFGNALKGSLSVLSSSSFIREKVLGKDSPETANWLDATDILQNEIKTTSNDNGLAWQNEYPEEFDKIKRFTNIVTNLKTVFVDSEQFVGRYRKTENRRTDSFIAEREALQKSISMILRDSSLELLPLVQPIAENNVKRFFGEF